MGIQDESRKESCQLYDRVMKLHKNGSIKYITPRDNVVPVLNDVDVVVLPSMYNEGVPRSLLEAMACGKPIITTDRRGCRDTVDHGINGFLVKPGNKDDLAYYMKKLTYTSYKALKKMGEASRRKAEAEFDENDVIDTYLYELANDDTCVKSMR